MTKATARRLKVFYASFGFHDSVVAAPSQVAALRAWGTHQNLFADGTARLSTDAAAIEAALQHPETPLRRAIGTTGPFELVPTSLPVVPVPRREKSETPGKPAKGAPAANASPDRTGLDQAKRALAALEAAREKESAALARRRDEIEAEMATAKQRYLKARKEAARAVQAAATAYRAEGGKV